MVLLKSVTAAQERRRLTAAAGKRDELNNWLVSFMAWSSLLLQSATAPIKSATAPNKCKNPAAGPLPASAKAEMRARASSSESACRASVRARMRMSSPSFLCMMQTSYDFPCGYIFSIDQERLCVQTDVLAS
jgi:hypothetical protein